MKKMMGKNIMITSSCIHADDDFIDIEVINPSSICSISSPPISREFDFTMSSSISLEKKPITSPADELFCQGQLLPLHLPPRLQMLQKLLQNSSNSPINTHDMRKKRASFHKNLHTPFTTAKITTTTDTHHPLEPCENNIMISPTCDSSRVTSSRTGEQNPNHKSPFKSNSQISCNLINDHLIKYSWSKKLKLIKRSALALKIKASRACLVSLFRKSRCSDQTCAHHAPICKGDETIASKGGQERLNGYMNVPKQHQLGELSTREDIDSASMTGTNTDNSNHGSSFSLGAKKMAVGIKCSSFSLAPVSPSSVSSLSCASSSNVFSEVHFLRRSNSACSEMESAIQGAIAYCKQSAGMILQKDLMFSSRKDCSY